MPLVKPRFAVPVHGEWRHMQRARGLAEDCGATPFLIEDGDVLRLARATGPRSWRACPPGRLAVDGDRLLPLDGGVLAARKRMLFNGVVVASLAVDGQGACWASRRSPPPACSTTGDAEPAQIAADLARAVGELPGALQREDDALREAARTALRKAVGRRLRKRPTVEVPPAAGLTGRRRAWTGSPASSSTC